MNYFLTDTGHRIDIVTDITVKMVSPLFEKKNTYTFPFDIPATPFIDLIFDRARLIDAANNKVRSEQGTLHIGAMKFTGTLIIKKTEKTVYRSNFTGQNASYAKMNSQNMDEMDLGEASLDFKGMYVYSDFLFEIENETAFFLPPHYNHLFGDNFHFVDSSSKVVNYFLSPAYPTNSYRRFLPAFFVQWIIKKGLSANGIYIDSNALSGVEYKGLVFLSNYWHALWQFSEIDVPRSITSIAIEDSKVYITIATITASYAKYAYVKLYNLNSSNRNYEGRIVQIADLDYANRVLEIDIDPETINASVYDPGSIRLVTPVPVYPDPFPVNKHMPRKTFMEFLDAIENATGTRTIFDESTGNARIVKLKAVILDDEEIDITTYAGKITESELTEETGYNIHYSGTADEYYQERVQELNDNYTLKAAVNKLSDLPVASSVDNDVRLVIEENSFYIFDQSNFGATQFQPTTAVFLGSWKFLSENFIAKTEGNGDIDIEINALPVLSASGDNFVGGRIVPRIDIPNNTYFTKEYSDAGIRLLFFNKLIGGYPVATTENDTLSLSLHGSKGIYEMLYKEYIDWRTNRARDAWSVINWPVRLINSFRWEKKFRIHNTRFLVKEITFIAGKNGSIRFQDTVLVRT